MFLKSFEVEQDILIAIDGDWAQSHRSVSSLICPSNTNMSRMTFVGQASVLTVMCLPTIDQIILYHDGNQ